MDELYAAETLLRPCDIKDDSGYRPCLIDRNRIPFKELWQEARFFADNIVCAVGTDFMQKIAESEHRFICDFLNSLQQMEVVDAVPVVRCKNCIRRYDTDECPMCHLIEGKYDEYTAGNGYCDRGERKTNDRD